MRLLTGHVLVIDNVHYLTWTRNGINTVESQINRIELFAAQLDEASFQSKNMIILGGANLCNIKWKNDNLNNLSAAFR